MANELMALIESAGEHTQPPCHALDQIGLGRLDHHVEMIGHQAESVRVYLNGELEIETNVIDASVGANDLLFFGGRCDSVCNWEGRLDEIAVFDRALEEAEIPALALRN